MSLNATPNGERIHIGIFGRRNAGKSSIFNAITGQNLAITSDIPGTTTDPVSKAMEILPLGPVHITDTPGFDDEGSLGVQRVNKSYDALRKTDIAVVVLSADNDILDDDINFIREIRNRNLPYIICVNKIDCVDKEEANKKFNQIIEDNRGRVLFVSADKLIGIETLKEKIAHSIEQEEDKKIVGDYIKQGDTVVLVVPIDESAPKGRLILPQQQVIRDILEIGATAVVTRETELEATLRKLESKPYLVITDSQAFKYVSEIVPDDIYLTSFSMLMARYKGDLEWQVSGAKSLDTINNGARILVCEGCTHHRQCADIGTVKIPTWIKKYTGKEFEFEFTSGGDYPSDVSKYDFIVHCGGCTLNEKEMKYRINKAREAGVPITNYGVLISYINGILERSLRLLTNRYQ